MNFIDFSSNNLFGSIPSQLRNYNLVDQFDLSQNPRHLKPPPPRLVDTWISDMHHLYYHRHNLTTTDRSDSPQREWNFFLEREGTKVLGERLGWEECCYIWWVEWEKVLGGFGSGGRINEVGNEIWEINFWLSDSLRVVFFSLPIIFGSTFTIHSIIEYQIWAHYSILKNRI